MGEEHVLKFLSDLGLTKVESRVYVFLAKAGPQKALVIAKTLSINRTELYRVIKSLQGRGVIESTLESPARFIAVPFEQIVDHLIRTKEDETKRLKSNRNSLR